MCEESESMEVYYSPLINSGGNLSMYFIILFYKETHKAEHIVACIELHN